MLQLVTTTGGRPEAFELCKRWMERQTYQQPVRWIVVDDVEQGEPPFQIRDWKIDIVRRTPYWKIGQNTQHLNLRAAFEKFDDHPVVIIEDDDWYSPEWLTTVAQWLEQYDLVGQGCNPYYNVQVKRSIIHHNREHASLCATAFRPSCFSLFDRVIAGNQKFIDIELWKHASKLQRRVFTDPPHYVVGIKGMPGRPGIGMGHQMGNRAMGTVDINYRTLRSWIGDDVEYYKPYG